MRRSARCTEGVLGGIGMDEKRFTLWHRTCLWGRSREGCTIHVSLKKIKDNTSKNFNVVGCTFSNTVSLPWRTTGCAYLQLDSKTTVVTSDAMLKENANLCARPSTSIIMSTIRISSSIAIAFRRISYFEGDLAHRLHRPTCSPTPGNATARTTCSRAQNEHNLVREITYECYKL